MLKAVILIGGPQKGTRFRPLSLHLPKPLFPVAGRPIIEHHIQACVGVAGLREILLLGSYPADQLSAFVAEMTRVYGVTLRYLHEYTYMGTGGGIYHFRDQIRAGNRSAFFVINGDVCGDFRLSEMLDFHLSRANATSAGDSCGAVVTMLATEATPDQSTSYGCVVVAESSGGGGDEASGRALHYVEKPETFVSSLINAGVYVCDVSVFELMAAVYRQRQQQFYSESVDQTTDEWGRGAECFSLEQHVLAPLAGPTGGLFVYRAPGPGAGGGGWWCQVKTAAAALYSSGRYLQLYSRRHRQHQPTSTPGLHSSAADSCSSAAPSVVAVASEETGDSGACKSARSTLHHQQQQQQEQQQQQQQCTIIGDVWIDATARVHRDAVLGPNVCVGPGVQIGTGVRVRDAILLDDARVRCHALITCAVVGWRCQVGEWARVQGWPCDPDPNRAAAKVTNRRLFSSDGKLQPSVTVLGSDVNVPAEKVVFNCVILPHKELERSYKNEILL